MALILHSKYGTGHVDIPEASLTKNGLGCDLLAIA